jgi:predicted secreted protein
MAAFALTYGYVSVGANDISTYVKSVELTVNGETVDVTAMSSTAWRSFVAGLRDWEVSVTCNTDVANGLLDSILWPLYSTSAAIELRATGAAVGTSNPKFTGSAIVVPGTIFGGSVGDGSETSFTLRGSGALTRATS